MIDSSVSAEPRIPRPAPPSIPTIDLLGMKVNQVTRAQALDLLRQFIASGEPHLVITADASMHVIANTDLEFLKIVNTAALVTPDSTGIVWASRKLGTPLVERMPGVEMAEVLIKESAEKGYGVYFYGSAPGVAQEAAEVMRKRYPGCKIVGTWQGFLSGPEEEAALIRDIQEKRPAVLLVALGIPKQEKWIARHFDELRVPVCMGVGGTLDVYSGRVNRAPAWWQRHGLEWLYRLLKNPSKLSKVATLPVFMLRVLQRKRLPKI